MIQKKLRLPLSILFVTLALYSCVLIPFLEYLINDIVLRDMIWIDLLDLLSRHFEIIGSILLLEFLIFILYRYSLRDGKPLFLIAVGALVFKYITTIVTYSIAFGSLDLTGGLTPYLVSFLLELVIAAAVVFFAAQLILPIKRERTVKQAAAKTLGREFDEQDPCYPFERVFSWKNPVLKTTLLSVLTVFLFQSIAFMISFISGAPMQASDIPVMLIYEVILVLVPCAYSYFLARLFFQALYEEKQPRITKKDPRTVCGDLFYVEYQTYFLMVSVASSTGMEAVMNTLTSCLASSASISLRRTSKAATLPLQILKELSINRSVTS